MTIIKGKANITAEVICDSISSINGKRITTFQLEYPRLIHSELKTHRMLSTNSASSRAIPFDKMIENLNGIPVRFGAANKGMQDNGEEYSKEMWYTDWYDDGDGYLGTPQDAWVGAKSLMVGMAELFYEAGYAKQIYNRLLEPFQMMKTIVTATELQNFFWLRDDEAADPTIQELARCMWAAMEQNEPIVLEPGQWHLPFVLCFENSYYIFDENAFPVYLSLEDAIIVSCARCAAVSFRNVDYDLAKCKQVYDRLINGGKVHGSALEHCATPMEEPTQSDKYLWQDGMTHMDKGGNMWSGNFQGWLQYRQLIPNESKKG